MSLLEEVASPLNCYPLMMRDEVEKDGLSTPCNGITGIGECDKINKMCSETCLQT